MRSTIVPLHVEITRYKSLVIEAIAYKRLDDKDVMDPRDPMVFWSKHFQSMPTLYYLELFEDCCLHALVQRMQSDYFPSLVAYVRLCVQACLVIWLIVLHAQIYGFEIITNMNQQRLLQRNYPPNGLCQSTQICLYKCKLGTTRKIQKMSLMSITCTNNAQF